MHGTREQLVDQLAQAVHTNAAHLDLARVGNDIPLRIRYAIQRAGITDENSVNSLMKPVGKRLQVLREKSLKNDTSQPEDSEAIKRIEKLAEEFSQWLSRRYARSARLQGHTKTQDPSHATRLVFEFMQEVHPDLSSMLDVGLFTTHIRKVWANKGVLTRQRSKTLKKRRAQLAAEAARQYDLPF